MAYTLVASWHIFNQSHGIYSTSHMAYTQSVSWHILNQSHGIYSIGLMAYTQPVSWHILNQSHGIFSISLMAYTLVVSLHYLPLKIVLFFSQNRNIFSQFHRYQKFPKNVRKSPVSIFVRGA